MLLASALKEEAHTEVLVTNWPKEPYKGLNFFTKEDAPLFGQRDTDTNVCTAIIGSVSSKVLLLHGRSGTGKSSFLRAGLLPRLEQAKLWCLGTPSAGGQPFLVRCTANPLVKLVEELLRHLSGDKELPFLIEANRVQAVSLLTSARSDLGEALAERLLEALSVLSHGLTRQIILTVDQGEELFTLCADNAERRAFFYFIEELCLRHLDVKLIVALRTEYYGQFCDQLRIDPTLKVSVTHTTLNQYMLHGLRSADQIVAAIVRPTLKDQLEKFGVPFGHYGFEFEPGLPERIAQDLLEHCGESSTLPAMQIVCRDLHHAVVLDRNVRVIRLAHYNALGRVEGRVSAFIEDALRQALRKACLAAPRESEIDKWKEVLADLVARQEGGVLATLLLDEATLVESAKGYGIRDDASTCLKAMAHEECRLLRVASRTDPVSRQLHQQYSLAHDSLAPTLLQWRQARKDVQSERTKSWWVRFFLLAAICFILVVVGGIVYQQYLLRSGQVKLYAALADGDSTPHFRTKLLVSLLAFTASEGILAPYLGEGILAPSLGHAAQTVRLKQLLNRVPMAVSEPVLAVGFNAAGTEIVMLGTNGEIFTRDLRRPDAVRHFVGQIDLSVPAGNSVAGFVAGLNKPVVINGGKLFWWGNNAPETLKPEHQLVVRDLVKDFGAGGFFLQEVAAGRIRVMQIQSNPRSYKFAEITFSDGQFTASETETLEWPRSLFPTFSLYSDRFAYIDNDARLRVTNRSNPTKIESITRSLGNPNVASLAYAPVGFVKGSDAIAVRNSRSEVRILESDPATERQLSVVEQAQDTSVRPRFGAQRPLIAGVRTERGLRLAWVAPTGILVLDAHTSELDIGTVAIPVRPPLLPAAALDSVVRLEFSADGRFLSAVSQTSFQEPVSYRVWDLSEDGKTAINNLDDKGELRKLACAAAALDGSNRLLPAEMGNWLPPLGKQPCGD